MLLLVLVVAAAAGLCPSARAQPLCGVRTVRTGKVFKGIQQVYGDILYFSSTTTCLIKHPCKENLAVYLGRQVFFTRDNFESSLLPFTIPTSIKVGVPEVTSAHFAGSFLLFVVNQKVYIYDYEHEYWLSALGIKHPVSHISGDNCCYVESTFCTEMSKSVFAYLRGDQMSQTNIYFSNDGGHHFHKFSYERQAELVGSLGGVFHFHSLSEVGLLVIDQGKGKFKYSDHPLNRSFGLPFDYNGTLDILMPPGQRGILILWFENSLLVSHNAGQLVSPIQVQQGGQTLYPSIYGANITIHNIAANENELAVLTREDNLYYGSLGVLSNSIIKFADQQIWSEGAALMFTGTGMLDILTPLLDANFSAFDFQKCSVNIQAILMDPQLQVEKCKIEVLEGDFEDQMYTIDMNGKLVLTAILIPRLGTSLVPLVMVSNPHSLGLQANFFEEKVTYNWNIKYRLEIYLKQQHLWGRTDPNFTSSLKRPTTSTLTVDVANKEISCIDNKPLSTLISVGCDLDKKIIVQKGISACSKGILDPVALQDNYSYVIEKEFYSPTFHGVKTDLVVKYPYQELGCPHLVYYNTPWKPVVELWREGRFQEVVEAEYVVREAYGQVAYTYSLTASSALCVSQPQNWTTMEESRRGGERFFWNRENYMSCHDPNSNAPLQWPNVEYQILGGPTANQIIFKQRNGIYIFFLSIVDPYYSYCHLSTVFSIYVYGAYPLPIVPPQFTIFLLVTSTLLSVWLAYTIPNFLRTERGRRIKTFWSDLCWGCKKLCRCHRGRS